MTDEQTANAERSRQTVETQVVDLSLSAAAEGVKI
jgi:hypothetical protein